MVTSWDLRIKNCELQVQSSNGPTYKSQRNTAMLLGRVGVALVGDHLQGVDQTRARLARFDHVIDVTTRGSDVRVGELLAILLDQLGLPWGGTFGFEQLLAEDNVHGAIRTHHRDLR